MNLNIPPLGTELILAKDWNFLLYGESRNESLFAALGVPQARDRNGFYDPKACKPVTLPAGAVLIVRRYYIRNGMKDFDSVTFSVKVGKKSCRFWAKLDDVNRIELAASKDEAEWTKAQAICDDPKVDEAIRGLLADQTGDNATCLVREVMRASAAQ